MSDTSQPNAAGSGNADPFTKATPQPMSTRLSGGSVTVTEGGTAPFVQPPARPGNPADSGAKPFRVGGG